MGIFGDLFKTVTAPARFVAKSPIGDVAKMAAPMVMGPGGIAVSAGIGALEESDEGVGDMLKGGLESGAQGAASYGMGKGVGALIGKGGAAAEPALAGAGAPGTEAMARGAAGIAPSGHPGIDPLGVAGSPVTPSATPTPGPGVDVPDTDPSGDGGIMSKLGLEDMPPWLKWSMLLQGASSLGQLGYGIYDNERARKRGDRFGDYLSRTAPSRPPPGGMY